MDLGKYGTSASLYVDDKEVLTFQVKGEYDFSYAKVHVADMDSDGTDEVLVLSRIPARYNGFMIQCAKFADSQWIQIPEPELDLSLDFSAGWQCTLSVNGEKQTVTVSSESMRAALFNENGEPVLEPAILRFYSDAPDHTVETNAVSLDIFVLMGGYDADGLEVLFTNEVPVTVYLRDGALELDADTLLQKIVEAFELSPAQP